MLIAASAPLTVFAQRLLLACLCIDPNDSCNYCNYWSIIDFFVLFCAVTVPQFGINKVHLLYPTVFYCAPGLTPVPLSHTTTFLPSLSMLNPRAAEEAESCRPGCQDTRLTDKLTGKQTSPLRSLGRRCRGGRDQSLTGEVFHSHWALNAALTLWLPASLPHVASRTSS